jgi:2-methylisocitrate lyase-like PEP mutase family enzyme
VQQFEEAGVAGVNIEDQVSPKRCGHMPGKDVVPTGEMVRKIEAACLARRTTPSPSSRGRTRLQSRASKAR